MIDITVAFWNIQNFGSTPSTKATYNALVGLVADVVQRADIDVLFIEELKQPAIGFGHLQMLQRALNGLPAPQNNWHYEYIKGALSGTVAVGGPWPDSVNLIWDAAHHEGYAVFWNQNLAKFTMQMAPPIQAPPQPGGGGPVPPPAVPNTQSETVRVYGQTVAAPIVPLWGVALPAPPAVPANGVVVPPNPAFTLPLGTVPGGAFVDAAGGAHAAGVPLAAATPVNAGTVLAAGTTIGAGGVTMTNVVVGMPPVVVPDGFILNNPLTLPAVGTVVIPRHALSLVTTGRDTTVGAGTWFPSAMGDQSAWTANFAPGGPNAWWWLTFPRAAGQPVTMQNSRRPAFVTVELNLNPPLGPANRLLPLISYHAPSAAVAAATGMQRASYSRPMYQAYDHVAGTWINTTRSVLGGDFNVILGKVAYPYDAFSDAFAAGGANANARVYSPAPPGVPNLAPPPPPPAAAPVGGWIRGHNTLNKTSAGLRTGVVGGAPIINASTNFYRKLAIDNVFYRGFAPAAAPMPIPRDVFDLVARFALGAGVAGVFPAATLMAFSNIGMFPTALAWHMGLVAGPAPALTNITNFPFLAWTLSTGNLVLAGPPANSPTARRAAETINRCVSDHLPVLFRFQL